MTDKRRRLEEVVVVTGRESSGRGIGFLPSLVKVEVNSDMFSPGDSLWLTAWWQNVGDTTAQQPLRCFLELEFGHQRIVETCEKYHRRIWEHQPGLQYWKPFELHAVTCHYKVPPLWGGTYRLFLGFCDEDTQPVQILDANGKPMYRVYIGDIELGWGWGTALIELARKPWEKEYNKKRDFLLSPVPEDPVIRLEGDIGVCLDAAKPSIRGIRQDKAAISAEPMEPELLIREYVSDRVLYSYQPEIDVEYGIRQSDADSVIYSLVVKYNGVQVAEASLVFRLAGRRLSIRLAIVQEAEGFELLEIRFPCLFALNGEDTHLIDFFGGGRLIPLSNTKPMGFLHNYDTRNAAAMYNCSGMVMLESHSLDDRVYVMAEETGAGKRAVMGAAIVTRVRARKEMRSIETPNTHCIDMEFSMNRSEGYHWMDFARWLRQGLRSKNRDIHSKAVHYTIYSTQGPAPEPWQVKEDSPFAVTRLNQGFKFTEILAEIRKYHHLFDGYRQLPFLYGYNKQNDDDGTNMSFPYAYETDPRAGTLEELKQCIEAACRYNTWLHLYENYDDIYLSRHADLTHAALDEYGKPYRGWIWADGLSYITGNRKYSQTGAMQERVKKMAEMYGPRKASYIDVLSSEVLRWDFDPRCPSSAETSLRYRREIIEEFNKYGMDVYSETLVHPYVGYMGYGHHTRINRGEVLFHGERYIPLIAAVYHGIIGYNGSGGSRKELLDGLVDAAFYNFEIDKPTEEPVKWVYLQNFPLGLLENEIMQECIETETGYQITYSGNCRITVDYSAKSYEIVHSGRTVGRDWTALVPGTREGDWLALSLDGGCMSYPAPEGWQDGCRVKAVVLTAEGDGEEVQCQVDAGKLVLHMPQSRPVRIRRIAAPDCSVDS